MRDGGAPIPFPDRKVGLDLRDWFAGHAMAAFISTSNVWFIKGIPQKDAMTVLSPGQLAERAFIMADAMLEEREKQNEHP